MQIYKIANYHFECQPPKKKKKLQQKPKSTTREVGIATKFIPVQT